MAIRSTPIKHPAAIIYSVNASDLTAAHSKRIAIWLIPALRLLDALRTRMVTNGFPPHDPLMLLAVEAHESVRQLRAKLHTIEVYKDPDRPFWLKQT